MLFLVEQVFVGSGRGGSLYRIRTLALCKDQQCCPFLTQPKFVSKLPLVTDLAFQTSPVSRKKKYISSELKYMK